ncbi:MAG: polyprenyl synthetase family protein [Clostridiaceae bacterium]|nr:polyprenyl synthetase family protein [Clostridiaceae bacterium]
MTFEEVLDLIRDELGEVTTYIDEILENIDEEKTGNYMRYFINSKGHRLRPMLVVLSYKCFKKEHDLNLIKLSTVLELLHTASLIHDDVIDEAEERRGQKSLNNIKGNKNSILIGNVFYLEAFRLAAEFPSLLYFKNMVKTSMEMCFGEIIQSESINTLLNSDLYLDIIRRKTAMLISTSCSEGARLAGATEEQIKLMGDIGLILGFLYQIKDDSKDFDVALEDNVNIQKLNLKFNKDFLESFNKVHGNNIYKEAILSIKNIICAI